MNKTHAVKKPKCSQNNLAACTLSTKLCELLRKECGLSGRYKPVFQQMNL